MKAVEFSADNSYLVSLDVRLLYTNILNGMIPKVLRL